MHAMLSRGVTRVQAPRSVFSRMMNQLSAWKTQFVRWYSGRPLQYDRIEDWLNQHPFGQKIKESLKRSSYTNQGKRAFKVVQNVEDNLGFKKGDFLAVDGLHKDHLEVFDKHGKWIGVANFDGTKNQDKTRRGKRSFRAELE